MQSLYIVAVGHSPAANRQPPVATGLVARLTTVGFRASCRGVSDAAADEQYLVCVRRPDPRLSSHGGRGMTSHARRRQRATAALRTAHACSHLIHDSSPCSPVAPRRPDCTQVPATAAQASLPQTGITADMGDTVLQQPSGSPSTPSRCTMPDSSCRAAGVSHIPAQHTACSWLQWCQRTVNECGARACCWILDAEAQCCCAGGAAAWCYYVRVPSCAPCCCVRASWHVAAALRRLLRG